MIILLTGMLIPPDNIISKQWQGPGPTMELKNVVYQVTLHQENSFTISVCVSIAVKTQFKPQLNLII